MAKKMASKECMTPNEMRLSRAQYWEFREAMEEMLHSKTRSELTVSKYRLMEKCIELDQLRAHLFKDSVKAAQEIVALKTKSYEAVREKIEAEIGYSLKNKAVNEITFEVTDISDNV